MSRIVVAVALVVAVTLLLAAVSPAAGLAATASATASAAVAEPSIVAVYPNPIADGDRGEFVVLQLPARPGESLPTPDDRLLLTDGETTIIVPSNATGRIAISTHPAATRNLTAHPVVPAAGLALANGGEGLELRDAEGTTLDSATYESAPEGDLWLPRSETWRSIGFRPRTVHSYGPTNATVFVLPDGSVVPLATLRAAEDRILLAGYTFVSERVTRTLIDASRRGIDVQLLLEGDPVGGLTRLQAALLDRLIAAGVDVRVVAGPYARVSFHHAKYAVVDDRALVLTENWKPAGTGGRSSRGWGVRIDSVPVAADLAGLFRNDSIWRDAIPWRRFRDGRQFTAGGVANGSYPALFEPARVRVARVSVLTAPGNAEEAVIATIDGADESVDVLQPTVEREGSFVRACLRAAERGVRVRVLLSGAWYAVEENRRIVAALNDYAEERKLSIEARIASPGGRFEKIHAKGLLVDDETVVLGSLNWNSHSAGRNREVAVRLESEAAAAYFGRVYDADWNGGGSEIPAGLILCVAVAVGVAVAVARKQVQFRK